MSKTITLPADYGKLAHAYQWPVDPDLLLPVADDKAWDTIADTGTATSAANEAGAAGIIICSSSATDDKYAARGTADDALLVFAAKEWQLDARFRLTESAATLGAFAIGISDVPSDDTWSAGVFTKGDDFIGIKKDYQAARISLDVQGTVKETDETITGDWQTVRLTGDKISATEWRITMEMDPLGGNALKLSNLYQGVPGRSTFSVDVTAFSGSVIFGVGNGSAAAQTLEVDYIRLLSVR